MKITRNELILISIVTALVIGMGAFWILEDPYVKSKYYKTYATATIELQYPDGAEYCKIQDKLVYNRPFAFIFKHKPSQRSWDWSSIFPTVNWRTGERINCTRVSSYIVERPATLIVWVRYYKDVVETNDGIELEMKVIVDTVRHEYSITPMSKSLETEN